MSALTINPAYTALLAKTPPRIIRSEEENQAYTEALYDLDQRYDSLSTEERELAELLTLLIENFETRYELARSTPLEVLNLLREQHDLPNAELALLLGGASQVTPVLAGGPLTTQQIRSLSTRFHVSPEVFF